MGQKIHPNGFRLGYVAQTNSRWFAKKGFAQILEEDAKIRRHIEGFYFLTESGRRDPSRGPLKTLAGISKVVIERTGDVDQNITLFIHASRPRLLIGKGGEDIDKLRESLHREIGKNVVIKIQDIRNADSDAQLLAQSVVDQLLRRTPFRRAMKKAVSSAMKSGAKGVRLSCKGRLGGTEMARYEWYHEGRVPLQTLRADMDYGFAEAKAPYGVIGVKAWVYKGDRL